MRLVEQHKTQRLYPQIDAGEEVPLDWRTRDYKMACCDCNLVHRFRFTVKGKTLIIQGWRDNRSTAQLRRRKPNPFYINFSAAQK